MQPSSSCTSGTRGGKETKSVLPFDWGKRKTKQRERETDGVVCDLSVFAPNDFATRRDETEF